MVTRLSASDASFYRLENSSTPMYVGSLQILRKPRNGLSYETLLATYWRQFDPTDDGGSFVDRGHQYTSAIFVHNTSQRRLGEASKKALGDSGRFGDDPIVTPIRDYESFTAADDYHQDFYKTHTAHYKRYRSGSGRDQFIAKVWGAQASSRYSKPSDEQLRERLTRLQYEVTQEEGTERPFQNEYWDNKAAGIYVDIVSGEPLFSSADKFKSGTGWPSFTRPMDDEVLAEDVDYKIGVPRTEIRSKLADSHLGHVFSDGPAPTGLRYCMNSASLRFVSKKQMEPLGYGSWLASLE